MNAESMIQELARRFDAENELTFTLCSWLPVYYYLVKYSGFAPETPSNQWVLWYTLELMQYINGHEVSPDFMAFMDIDNWDNVLHPLTDDLPGENHKDWSEHEYRTAETFIKRYTAMHERYKQ